MLKKHLPAEWCERFGIEMIDADGWRTADADIMRPIDIVEFVTRMNASTIMPLPGHSMYLLDFVVG